MLARYQRMPYQSFPVYDNNIGTYLTGQHIDPYKPETKGGLTRTQIEGRDSLTTEQWKRFPYPILANTPQILYHGQEVDLSQKDDGSYVNPKDKALYEYWLHLPEVAKTKEDYNVDRHIFYIEDKEAEAVASISKRELIYKAMDLMHKNASFQRLTEVALLLNYYVPQVNIPTQLSKNQLENRIYDVIDSHPEKVIQCFSENAAEDLFILKLVNYGIITRKENDFYDGETFLGNNVNAVKMFGKENQALYNKWGKLLLETEGLQTDKEKDTDKDMDKDTSKEKVLTGASKEKKTDKEKKVNALEEI